jgi:hypothetical protein
LSSSLPSPARRDGAPRSTPPRWSAASFLTACCLGGYLAIGHGFGDFYPISPLGMFREQMTSSSRIVARPVGGEPIEIAWYVDWHCAEPLDFSNQANPSCPKAEFSAYDDIVADYILSNQGPPAAGEPVEIVRRQFTIENPSDPIRISDCTLLSCTARRVEPSRWTPRL